MAELLPGLPVNPNSIPGGLFGCLSAEWIPISAPGSAGQTARYFDHHVQDVPDGSDAQIVAGVLDWYEVIIWRYDASQGIAPVPLPGTPNLWWTVALPLMPTTWPAPVGQAIVGRWAPDPLTATGWSFQHWRQESWDVIPSGGVEAIDPTSGKQYRDIVVARTGSDGTAYPVPLPTAVYVPPAPPPKSTPTCPSGFHWDDASQSCVPDLKPTPQPPATEGPQDELTLLMAALLGALAGFGGGLLTQPSDPVTCKQLTAGVATIKGAIDKATAAINLIAKNQMAKLPPSGEPAPGEPPPSPTPPGPIDVTPVVEALKGLQNTDPVTCAQITSGFTALADALDKAGLVDLTSVVEQLKRIADALAPDAASDAKVKSLANWLEGQALLDPAVAQIITS